MLEIVETEESAVRTLKRQLKADGLWITAQEVFTIITATEKQVLQFRQIALERYHIKHVKPLNRRGTNYYRKDELDAIWAEVKAQGAVSRGY